MLAGNLIEEFYKGILEGIDIEGIPQQILKKLLIEILEEF